MQNWSRLRETKDTKMKYMRSRTRSWPSMELSRSLVAFEWDLGFKVRKLFSAKDHLDNYNIIFSHTKLSTEKKLAYYRFSDFQVPHVNPWAGADQPDLVSLVWSAGWTFLSLEDSLNRPMSFSLFDVCPVVMEESILALTTHTLTW